MLKQDIQLLSWNGNTSRIPLYPSRSYNPHLHRPQEPYIQQLYNGPCLSLEIKIVEEYSLKIFYVKGVQNIIANMLSQVKE